MSENVFIKGNKYGIKIIINEDANISSAYNELKEKLIAGKKFFGSDNISLDLEYRYRNEELEKKIIKLIEENTDLKVFCLIDENIKTIIPEKKDDSKKELYLKMKESEISKKEKDLEKRKLELDEKFNFIIEKEKTLSDKVSDSTINTLESATEYAKFYQGTLRSGQELKSDRSIVLLGDVNPGAKIISAGNIIVLGSIKGFAHAGATGKDKASIFAINLKPTQLRIAEFIARAPKSYNDIGPSIAFVEDERIMIDKIDKGQIKDFILLK